jgi:ring-1,2-phenylacetyl-CoA epoxidase subunit PaaB
MSQWPRYEVFEQEREGRPHQNAGSVHAPDAEMALQNARDVFVRRPSCLSLWVVPESAILARTAEELAAEPGWPGGHGASDARAEEVYYVFRKSSQRRSMTFVGHCGEVEAASPEQALRRAVAQYGDSQSYVWWVCPERAITRSDPADAEAFFSPAEDKSYRLPHEYRVLTAMQQVTRE